jgi:hypothetical protein
MTVYDLNTQVIRSDDDRGRIAFSSGDPIWGDHVRIEWMPETMPGQWYYAHFSPDKAELFGRMLIKRAAALRTKVGDER